MPKANNISFYAIAITALLSLFSAAAFAANTLNSVRIWAAPDSTRVVFDLGNKPDFKYFTLNNPERLVIDLDSTHQGSKLSLANLSNNSQLVKRVRFSKPPKKGILRLVIDLKQAANANLFSLPPTGPYGDRLVVDFESGRKTTIKQDSDRQPQDDRDIIVAIDAGHGGDDPGSIGPSGMYEKRVALAIAKRVADEINAVRGMKAIMTRSGDYFVDLNRRSELARKGKADLLVSIHADAFTSPQPRGASVWVLSNRRANSEMGRLLEQSEKVSELLGGVGEIVQNTDSEQYLMRTLIDMSMDNSRSAGFRVADDILSRLGKVTKLHKSSPEYASLAVLKSPDIPSLLVETGFISNPTEEKLLRSSNHQQKLANAIYGGIISYFQHYPPEGTLLARSASINHSVSRGESLSVIAARYNVSVAAIKKANNLKSNMLRIGQKLVIPRA
ncbi:N-acetylmuramoyl-L-alanine amidase [Shewanella mangrovi]|uniref:N-acetylmuramoyl-L-alanine amidase AmiC n=1 Tax=Shewanella mangrovi TaxID=1515746 RepID=A0A094JE66_9GAMM|nr:N-acetylmuramoyl-L-alanine amidase [Shewanella mangrovi]KFZ37532.1 N-acetylmuramoyl-L-alanine amidase [Shewanella mangrovi]